MADLVDKSGSAGSNLVQGTGTATATFSMPGSVQLDVESVVATIDNTAGGATTPTLVVRDSSGEVIATKRMGDTIPAGDTGTAAFSLRNSADAASGDGIQFDVDNIGGYLEIDANDQHASVIDGSLAAWNIAMRGETIGVGAEGAFSVLTLASENLLEIHGGIFQWSSDTDVNLNADAAMVLTGTSIDVTAAASGMSITSGGSVLTDLSGGAGQWRVKIPAGSKVEVRDHNNNAIFRVDENGDLHGKTGKALVFDL